VQAKPLKQGALAGRGREQRDKAISVASWSVRASRSTNVKRFGLASSGPWAIRGRARLQQPQYGGLSRFICGGARSRHRDEPRPPTRRRLHVKPIHDLCARAVLSGTGHLSVELTPVARHFSFAASTSSAPPPQP
jgi:hypothetical protein